ncbi:hypothetical protein IE077_003990, partial [Cardiosporidium cionae]
MTGRGRLRKRHSLDSSDSEDFEAVKRKQTLPTKIDEISSKLESHTATNAYFSPTRITRSTLDEYLPLKDPTQPKQKVSKPSQNPKSTSIHSVDIDEYFARIEKPKDVYSFTMQSSEEESDVDRISSSQRWQASIKLQKSKKEDDDEKPYKVEATVEAESNSTSEYNGAEEESSSEISVDDQLMKNTLSSTQKTPQSSHGQTFVSTENCLTSSPSRRRPPSFSISTKSSPPKKNRETPAVSTVLPAALMVPAASSPQASAALPLQGYKMVFTGVFQSFTREAIVDKAKECGASVTLQVSGKTDFLVSGSELEDGRAIEEGSKYKKVQQLILQKGKMNSPTIMTEEEFLKKISSHASMKENSAALISPAENKIASDSLLKSHRQILSPSST